MATAKGLIMSLQKQSLVTRVVLWTRTIQKKSYRRHNSADRRIQKSEPYRCGFKPCFKHRRCFHKNPGTLFIIFFLFLFFVFIVIDLVRYDIIEGTSFNGVELPIGAIALRKGTSRGVCKGEFRVTSNDSLYPLSGTQFITHWSRMSANSRKGLGGLDFGDELEGSDTKKEGTAEVETVEAVEEPLPTILQYHDK